MSIPEVIPNTPPMSGPPVPLTPAQLYQQAVARSKGDLAYYQSPEYKAIEASYRQSLGGTPPPPGAPPDFVIPPGSKLTYDIAGFNKQFGTNLKEAYPGAGFAVVNPQLEAEVNVMVRATPPYPSVPTPVPSAKDVLERLAESVGVETKPVDIPTLPGKPPKDFVIPSGYTATYDIVGFNRQFGTTLGEAYPGAGFALVPPSLEAYVGEQVRLPDPGRAALFFVDPNWTVLTKDAQGSPSEYLDPKTNQVYFAPGSAMWQLGWNYAGNLVWNNPEDHSLGYHVGMDVLVSQLPPNSSAYLAWKEASDAYDTAVSKSTKDYAYYTSQEYKNTELAYQKASQGVSKFVTDNFINYQSNKPGPSAGTRLVGQDASGTSVGFTITRDDAVKLAEVIRSGTPDDIFKHEQSLGIIPREALKPSEVIRLNSLMLPYLKENGKYDIEDAVSDVLKGGITILSLSDLAEFIGGKSGISIDQIVSRLRQPVQPVKSTVVRHSESIDEQTSGYHWVNGTEYIRNDITHEWHEATDAEYTPPPSVMFASLVSSGKVPEGATMTYYNPVTSQFGYVPKEYTKALEILKPFKEASGKYDILSAMAAAINATTNKEDMAIVDALAIAFPKDAVEAIRQANLPGLTIGTFKENSIWGKSWSEAQSAIPAVLVGALGGAKQTPFPHDDMIVGALLVLVVGGLAIYKTVENFVDKYGRTPKPEDIVVVKASPVASDLLAPKGGYIIDVTPFNAMPSTLEQMIPAYIPTSNGEVLIPPSIKFELEQFLGVPNAVTFLPTPGVQFKADDYILKSVELGSTQKHLVDTIPVNYNKILDTVGASRDWQSTLDMINTAIGKQAIKGNRYQVAQRLAERIPSPGLREISMRDLRRMEDRELAKIGASGVYWLNPKTLSDALREDEDYTTAHEEYLRKLAIWKDAWHSYVASLDPSPIQGFTNDTMMEALALFQILRYINPGIQSKTFDSTETNLDTGLMISPFIETAVRTYTQVMADSKVKGMTNTEAVTQAQQAVQQMLKDLTKTQTQAQTQTQTKTQVKQAVNQATQAQTQTQTGIQEQGQTKTTTDITTPDITTPDITTPSKIPPLPLTDKETKKKLKASDFSAGVVMWGQGGVRPGYMWKVVASGHTGEKPVSVVDLHPMANYAVEEWLEGVPVPSRTIVVMKGSPKEGYTVVSDPAERRKMFPEGNFSGPLGFVRYNVDPWGPSIKFTKRSTSKVMDRIKSKRNENSSTSFEIPPPPRVRQRQETPAGIVSL